LELGNPHVNDLRGTRYDRPYGAALSQETDESAHAADILRWNMAMPTNASTLASMPCKARDGLVIDINKSNIRTL
jgi:hypothetical protein